MKNKYKIYDGAYIMCRKRELYMREDDTFKMNTIFNFKKFES